MGPKKIKPEKKLLLEEVSKYPQDGVRLTCARAGQPAGIIGKRPARRQRVNRQPGRIGSRGLREGD